MARIGVGNKYNLAINGKGYLVRGLNYKKKDARIFAPRFGTGEMGETDLDTWKAWSQDEFNGGSFQELLKDNTKVDSLNKIMRDPRTGLLHPTPISNLLGMGGSIDSAVAWVVYGGVLYKSHNYYDSGSKGAVYKLEASTEADTAHLAQTAAATTIVAHDTTGFNSAGGVITIGTERIKYTSITATDFVGCTRGYDGTTAAAIADNAVITQYGGYKWTVIKTDFGAIVRDMVVFNNCLYVACSDKFWKWTGSAWTSLAATAFGKIKVFNGKIYGSSGGSEGKLWSHNGDLSTSVGVVGTVGDAVTSANSLEVFNHRLYIGKPEGLFAYDGVQISCVIDMQRDRNPNNFRYMAEFNGSLYWVNKNVLYKFNGSTVEVVQDLTNLQTIYALSSGYGRLWLATTAPSGYYVDGGKGGEVPTNAYCLYYYDGEGLTLYDDTQSGVMTPYCIAFVGSLLVYFSSGANAVVESYSYIIDLSEEYCAHSLNVGTIYPSIFDAGFPNINKSIESFEVDYEAISTGDTIGVYYKLYNGIAWDSAWSTLGTITSTSSNRLYVHDTSTLSDLFKKIKFKIVLTRGGASVCSIRGYSMKYIISPEYKREWQISLLCVGTSDNPLELLDGTNESNYSHILRENIYAARDDDNTVPFEDIDFTIANGAITTTATTINVDTTALFPATGFLKIDDEIIKYSAKTASAFTGCTRAVLGTTAATHTDNEIVNMYYRVILSDILNEEVYFATDITTESSPTLTNPETIITVGLKEA